MTAVVQPELSKDGMTNPTTISDLPDGILHHILSSLPTKDAFKTSLVSKRWQSLWTSITRLEFDEDQFITREFFMDFVDTTLLLREGQSIGSFSLSCWPQQDESRVNTWIAVAVKHKVLDLYLSLGRQLHLNMFRDRRQFHNYKLPCCIFRGETLRKLHLNMFRELNVPSWINLPSLNDLTLEEVRFVDNEPTRKLLSGPSLERLSLRRCCWRRVKEMTISVPKLHILSIELVSDGWDRDRDSDTEYENIVIYGPRLEWFLHAGGLANRFSVVPGSPSVLSEASVYVNYSCAKWEKSEHSQTLLRGISSVKSLNLSIAALQIHFLCEKFKDLEGAFWIQEKDPFKGAPVFSNLTTLKFLHCRIRLHWQPLSSLFRRCPSLKTLEFCSGCYSNKDPDRPPHDMSVLPSLEKITIGSFSGMREERAALRILLRSAPLLKEVVLRDKGAFENKKHLHEQYFSLLPRASSSCRIRMIPCISKADHVFLQ